MAHSSVQCVISLGSGPSGLDVVLITDGGSPAVGQLDGGLIEAAAAACAGMQTPGHGLLIPGNDLESVRREREAARALWVLMTRGAGAAVGERLQRVCGQAQVQGGRLLLVFDARTAPLRALAWEALSGMPPDELGLAVDVCRLRPGGLPGVWPPATAPTAVRVGLWIPNLADAICRQIAGKLAASLDDIPLVSALAVGPDAPAPPDDTVFDVLHIVAHGVSDMDGVRVDVGQGERLSADAALHRLRRPMAQASLIYLDICSGGATGAASLQDVPGWRMATEACSGVVAPLLPLATDASVAMSAAFYAALASGDALGAALSAGRSAVGALGIAHPSCRPWNMSLVVADGQVASLPPVSRHEAVSASWLSPSPRAAAVIAEAERQARRFGYLGVEHLLLAFLAVAGELIPPAVEPNLRRLTEGALTFHALTEAEIAPLSPRCQALAASLPEGFGVEDLFRAVIDIPWVMAALPAAARQSMLRNERTPGATTWTAPAASLGRAAPHPVGGLTLEVEGGPEDGRRLSLAEPGQLAGRHDPDGSNPAEVTTLFIPPAPQDRGVSRRHLRYEGGGCLTFLAPGGLIRDNLPRPTDGGPVKALTGDLLTLGLSTRLRVV